MTKVGILAGGGKLPIRIGESLLHSNYDVIFFCIKNFCNPKLYKDYVFENISINSFSKILQKLKNHKVEKIVMAGHITRPSIKDIDFDLNVLKLIKNFALDSKGDDRLLSTISIFFENNGFPILDWKKECKDLFINEQYLTSKKPSEIAKSNIKKGLLTFEIIGRADLSQSMIIQNNIVLGVEAAEGTDELIKRCYK